MTEKTKKAVPSISSAASVTAKAKGKAPAARLEYRDAAQPGLYLVHQPSGALSWAVRGRVGIQNVKTGLGRYASGEDLTKAGDELTAIRAKARETLAQMKAGINPKTAKKEAADEAAESTFEAVARRFIRLHVMGEGQRNRKPRRTWVEMVRHLGLVLDEDGKTLVARKDGAGLIHEWGARQIADITVRDVNRHLEAVMEGAGPIAANRRLSALSKLFNWSIGKGEIDRSPCLKVAKPAEEAARDRILYDTSEGTPDPAAELRLFLKAAGEMPYPFGPALLLLARTGQRRDEVMKARWSEFKGDVWTIPADRAKNGKEHTVHLDEGAMAILAKLPRTGGKDGFLFTMTGDTAVSGYSRAKDGVDARMLKLARKDNAEAVIKPWRFHDLRRTAATVMSVLGTEDSVISRILNHTKQGVTARHYNHNTDMQNRRRALEIYGSYLDGLLKEQPSNVVPMRAVAN